VKKIVKYVGLDVHKDSITITIADEGRDGNVRVYGKIHNDLGQIDKVMRKLISKNSELHCVYEAGPCGYTIYRHLISKGMSYSGKSKWSKGHLTWLAELKMPHPAQQIALTEYLDAMENQEARITRLDKSIVASCQTWRLLPVVEALQALRGISSISEE